ncbi:MAG: hypothetical protein HY758_07265, partial [Nitrospirae bacterium]|nr:hypothetical protein [Nitrospirota bacterium]
MNIEPGTQTQQTGNSPRWYAVHVRSRHEVQVFERLKMKSIEAFLPTVER